MPSPVVSHHFTHVVEQLLAMFRRVHVDKVDDNDASHVPQAQLTCDFVGGADIHVQGIFFLIVGVLVTVAGIDVNNM